ncbi:hypothetical protein EJ06DRAFT_477843 [Trichodelitschia bisporula]|uniref:SprT-like domain-containing protein n=1 Tax=Trichodelitschia bisporula TaxID=703511 RepID=A0A6G1HVP0_9PEZI|nr:hypothetical protein EJ06DRAFT_477843 [Trichodelitschia bisporula]
MDDDAINSPRRGLIRRTWDGCKNDIAVAFLYEIDEAMTGGEVGRATEDTGGVRIVWTNKLSTTAGRASWRVERVVINGQREERKHWATIELAEKVVDSEERLINVIAHEYCHLATYIVSGVRDRPHGKEFREWGKQATKLYHDRGVVVTTKHTYDIKYKYIWRCTGCTLHIQRHSKSIKPATQLCGICQGRLEQIKPAPRVRAGEDVDMGPPPQLNAYASFVKENYQLARELSPQGALPKTIMGNLARMYRDQKEMRAKMFTEHDAAKMADAMANRAGMESDGEDGKENKRAENEGDDGGYENEVEVEGAECITDAMGRVDLTE